MRQAASAGTTPVPEAERLALLRLHGNFPVAYSVAMQEGLLHFGDADGIIGYLTVGRTAFVLGDPLAPPERVPDLLDRFLEAHPDACFCQIAHQTAVLLNARGATVNALGEERAVPLAGFRFAGPRLRSFRTAENRFAGGFTVDDDAMGVGERQALAAVSRGWRATKVTKRHELRLLVRPVVLEDEPGVRKFLLRDGARLVRGFASFDPVYEDGRLSGYLAATRRWLPDLDPLAGYFLMKRAVETFRAEGVGRIHLGLSPFRRIEDTEFTKDWLTRRVFRLMYRSGFANRFLYPARTLSRHKEMWGGEHRQVYFAMTRKPSLPRLVKLLRACRIV